MAKSMKNYPNMAPVWVKRVPKLAPRVPKGRPKGAKVAPRAPQVKPKVPQGGPKGDLKIDLKNMKNLQKKKQTSANGGGANGLIFV